MSSPSPSSDPLSGLDPEQLLDIAAEPLSQSELPPLTQLNLPTLDEVSTAFPDLELVDLIGHGGMSAVFKARQPQLDRVIALKVLPKSLAETPGFTERFSREGRVLARLSHPNIVTVHDFGESGGFAYLIMEYVDGVNLRQAMRAGRFTPEQALQIIPAICDALQFAHGQGVLHRDIKPENILLDSKGKVKIVDFGIAKILGEEVDGAMLLTQSGAKLGTAPYMAPEQIEKPSTVDHRADIYSLGVVFYEMLTGELPLGRFAAPSELANVGGQLDQVVFRSLEKQRGRRQQSAEEFKTEVAGAGSQPEPKRRLRWLAVAVLFNLLACGLLLLWALLPNAIEAWTLIPVVVTAAGVVMFATAVPLWLRLVPMNSWYGLRLPSTKINEERWYAANAFVGRQLCAWATLILAAGVAGFFQLPRHQDHYGWAVLALALTAVVASSISIWSWLRQHPVNAPAKKPSRLGKSTGQFFTAIVIAYFIKGFIFDTYRIAGRAEAGVPQGSHWIASKLDTGFDSGDLICFEHDSSHAYIARVMKREDTGLLLKRGGVEEEFFVEWDKVIGKLLFSHLSPVAVRAAGEVKDRTPDPKPPIEGTSTALGIEPVLRFVRAKCDRESWDRAPICDPQGNPLFDDEAVAIAAKVTSDGMGSSSPDECRVQLWFEHPDFDQKSTLSVELLQSNGQPLKDPLIMQSKGVQDLKIRLVSLRQGYVKLPDKVNVKLTYSIGPWKHVSELKPDSRSRTSFGNNRVSTAVGDDSEHHAFIGWTGPRDPNVQYDAVAVLKSGSRIGTFSTSSVTVGEDKNEVTSTAFPVPLRDIKEFQIRSREVKTVEFRDVVIPPTP
jgi:serine/threonine protein kinase